jgi:hypothetical protein
MHMINFLLVNANSNQSKLLQKVTEVHINNFLVS